MQGGPSWVCGPLDRVRNWFLASEFFHSMEGPIDRAFMPREFGMSDIQGTTPRFASAPSLTQGGALGWYISGLQPSLSVPGVNPGLHPNEQRRSSVWNGLGWYMSRRWR